MPLGDAQWTPQFRSPLDPCLLCRLHGSADTKFCLQEPQKYQCCFPAKPMNQGRNPTGYPHHHQNCRVLHSVRTHPCFPLSNDAHTKLQKKWIEENKENIPPPNLRREEAFKHPQKVLWKKDEPEAIEEDDSESDSEEEEGHDGSKHSLPSRSVNSSNNKPHNPSKR